MVETSGAISHSTSVKHLLPLLALVVMIASPAEARSSRSAIKISGVLFDGAMKGNEEPESAIRLTNTTKRTVKIGGFSLTDEFTPGKRKNTSASDGVRRGKGGGPKSVHTVRIPSGTKLGPYEEIWLAHEARAFKMVFGERPDFEATDTDPRVRDLESDTGWIFLAAKHGTLALVDGGGEVLDFVAYDRNKTARYKQEDLPEQHWKGPPVPLFKSSFYGWTNQILSRDRDEKGRLLRDTNSSADWDSGNSNKALGVEPVHRIEIPGQSTFVAKRLKNVKATVLATSAPDNNFGALIAAFGQAKSHIRVSVYQLTNPKVGAALEAALARGVKVDLWMEGAPVGGIPDQERYLLDKLAKRGANVHFLISDPKKKLKARYRFDHSKYVIVDEHKIIVGTENYGRTGVPIRNSFGNRGWMVHVEQPTLVKQLQAVWDHDRRPDDFRDIVGIDDNENDRYGLPYLKDDFEPDFTVLRGFYKAPKKPLKIRDRMDLELVLSPDTSLNENTALIGMMNRAKKSLLVEQNSIRLRWGRKTDKMTESPDLPLMAIIAAARRGVKTRVLLDGTWYNISGTEDRDNDDVCRYLNELARKEKLDLSAKVINLKAAALVKIHTKGLIVDDKEVFVGSINWTENSFKGNREVGVIIGHKKVAGYYADLFWRDWSESRMYASQTTKKVKARQHPKVTAKPVKTFKRGDVLSVVGEHGGNVERGPDWLEVRLMRGRTGFVKKNATKFREATPAEAIHRMEQRATIVGRVVQTKVSSKVIQLRFEDDERPPFVAVIFKRANAKFQEAGVSPADDFQGKIVRVSGTVQAYKMPEIIITDPKQIEIVR